MMATNRGPVVSRRNVLRGIGGYFIHPHLAQLQIRQRQAAAAIQRMRQLRTGTRLSSADLKYLRNAFNILLNVDLSRPSPNNIIVRGEQRGRQRY